MSVDTLLLGDSAVMNGLRQVIRKLAPSPLAVLLRGPRGAGKELVAHALHAESGRAGAFVAFNACAIADSMFEDALFGHVRGAFTGATADAPGFFGEADRGTVLLDEIGGVSLANQRKLLRAIETRRFRPVGGRADRGSDFRVVSATNDDLAAMIQSGAFRGDLADRLGVLVIDVPPLAARLGDVPMLARRFAAAMRPAHAAELADGAVRLLMTYDWPGNVRQLRLTVERAVLLSDSALIDASTIARAIEQDGRSRAATADWQRDQFERRRLLDVLDLASWDVGAAAVALGVDRSTVYRRLRRLGITGARNPDPPRIDESPPSTPARARPW